MNKKQIKFSPDTWIHRVKMSQPCLGDNVADTDRLTSQLKDQLELQSIQIDLSLIAQLPGILRYSDFDVLCTLFGCNNHYNLLEVQPTNDYLPVFGLAVDLGTTRVVLRFLDLINQKIVTETNFENPQASIAPDVLARIHYTDQTDGLKHMQELIINGINQEIQKVCTAQDIAPERILCMSVAGNTCMTHLFLGLPPHSIIREPYIPVVNRQLILPASDLSLQIHPQACVFVFPNIGSYFGGDLIAGILYLDMHHSEETAIMVDVGTNAEVVLGNKDWMLACAGAAGPALEGGVSKIGITARAGAIERIKMQPGSSEFEYQTIENKKPVGICGSGIIDLAAVLFKSGMLDIRGKFVPEICKDQLTIIDDINHFMVVPKSQSATSYDLTLSQVDIDSLIRSKAAMYTILTTISRSVGLQLSDISKFYVAGTFGAYIDPTSAISIGMIPDLPLSRYKSVGNTSIEGASRILMSRSDAELVPEIHKKITYMELNVNQEFMNQFSAAKFLPHTDLTLFPSVDRSMSAII
ncbi:metal-binding protein [Candidatus Magnetomorum sp. HK-1]|nr:metal-binding protein [Candidatus Magnetomorum sp. HK-1]